MELSIRGLEIRIVGVDGLTKNERRSINILVKKLGWKSVQDLAEKNGYSSPREMAYGKGFKCVRDFFFGKDWYSRLGKYDKNNKTLANNQTAS